jgi:alkanesulfonate monooxygenase SsuD/methylene tetrahydromethanopterin reductase-like flavin-dependent oxidoreductase (luciferase family)
MRVRIGAFIVPDATDPDMTLKQIQLADETGLDYVAIQDHPYQRRFFDTWTLLSYAAASTEHVRFVPDVLNLPLRPPAVIAKSVDSLDLLSGGRVELALGAGGFWEAIEAMGGPRRSPKQSVDALEEALQIIRGFWSGQRSLNISGEHYTLKGVHPGPQPAHPIGIWVGARGPRMLKLIGRLADGWLPSLGGHYLTSGELANGQAAIDAAARTVGRDPAEIERAVNVMELLAPPDTWAEQLARIATELRFSTLLIAVPGEDPVAFVRRLGQETAPALRELLA